MLILLVAATLAGGCGVQYSTGYGYGYAAPAYNYGARVSYGATYQPTYTYPQPAYDYKAVVGQYLREEYAEKEKEQAQAEIKAKLDRLELLLAAPKQAPVAAPPPVQAPPPVYYQPAPVQLPTKATPQQAPFAQAPTPQYPPGYQQPAQQAFGAAPTPPPLRQPPGAGGDQAVAQILGSRCARCHTAPATKGAGIVLLDPQGNLAPMNAALMLAVQEDVKTGHMPKDGPQLPDDELAIISGWVGDHAPEIAAFLAQGLGR